MSINNQSSIKKTGLPRPYSIGACGLSVERDLSFEVARSVVGATSRYSRFFTPRKYLGVNEVEYREARNQDALRDIPVASAKTRLAERVGAHAIELTVEVEGVGFIPMSNGSTFLAIIDLSKESQGLILDERVEVVEAMESFAPDAVYNWRRYSRPGIPFGTVQICTESRAENEIIRQATIEVLPDLLSLLPAHYLPREPEL